MSSGMLRCLILLFLILLGYCLRRVGVLTSADRASFAKGFMNICLPAVVVSSFSTFSMSPVLPALFAVGLCSGLLFAAGQLLAYRRSSPEKRAFAVTNGSSLSIGSFAIPFLQPYLPAEGLLMIILFDTGNSMMAASGCYVLGSRQLGRSQSLGATLRMFLSSPPLCSYLAMFLLHMAGLRLPSVVYEAAGFIGGANPVLVMLVVGMTLRFSVSWPDLKQIFGMLAVHYAVGILFSLVVVFALPLPPLAKSISVVLLFSPMTALGIPFTERLGLNPDLSAVMSSVSILASIVLINLLIPAMGLA